MRKRIEGINGWIKRLAGGAKLRYRGVVRNQPWVELTAPAYALLRIAKLPKIGGGVSD